MARSLNPKSTSKSQSATTPSSSRRRFLGVASAGVALTGFPAIVKAQGAAPITLRVQSAYPVKALFHEFAVDFSKRLEEAAGGRIKVQMLSAGAVVPGLQVIEAVSKGVLDGGCGVPFFWFGKNTAFGLYGGGPNFALDANTLLGWVDYGGGRALYEELLAAAQLDVTSFLFGPIPCEPLGWFKKEIRSVADFKGLKFRTAGLAVDLMQEFGAAPVQLAPGDIVPSIDRRVIDAAEFANATDDRLMGFPDVAKFYYQRSYHSANSVLEIMINKKKFESLPADIKPLFKIAANAASADMAWKSMDRMSTDLIEMQTKQSVRVIRTPRTILDAQLKMWDRVIAKHSAENPLFARIVASQKAWAKRVVYWQNEVTVSNELAYSHYFPKGPVA